MFFENDELVKVAEVVRSHGFDGSLSLKVHSDFDRDIISEEMPVFLIIEGIPVPFFIDAVKNSGTYRIAKIRNINDEAKAAYYIGCEVMIFKSLIDEELPEIENSFEGYSVFDEKYGYIGKFTFINEIPGNPVFETDFNGKTIIIPYSDEFVLNADDQKKEIRISAPEGLIELYMG